MELDRAKETLPPPDLKELRNFAAVSGLYEVSADGIIFNDVLTGEPIVPGELPPFMRGAEARGWQHLRELGERNGGLLISFFQAPHGSREDFEETFRQHEDALQMVAYLGLEMPMQQGHGYPRLAENPGRRRFQEASLEWCLADGKLALPCERPTPSDDLLDVQLNALWELRDNIAASRQLPDGTTLDAATKNAVCMILDSLYQIHRQPTIPEQLGRWLKRLRDYGHTPENANIGLLLGSWHSPTAEKLRAFCGARVEEYPVAMPPSPADRYGERFKDTMRQGRLDLESLQIPLPY